jgi:hypothetical protein
MDYYGINVTSIRMWVDGTEVTGLAGKNTTEISFLPSAALGEGSHNVTVVVADNSTNGNVQNYTWNFTVNYTASELLLSSTAVQAIAVTTLFSAMIAAVWHRRKNQSA